MSEISGKLTGVHEDEPPEKSGSMGTDGPTGRWLRRQIVGPVVAVTTTTDRGFRGATVSAFLVASVEPLQLLISIERETQMEEWLRQSRVFAVSILQWRQKLLADQFAGLAPLASPTFAGISHFTETTGCPIIRDAIAWADCTVQTELVTGDHRLFVGGVEAAGDGDSRNADPLIYYANRFRRLQ